MTIITNVFKETGAEIILKAVMEKYLEDINFSFCFYFSRSTASYRLKHRVSLKDIWLCGFEDEPEEEEGPVGDIDLRVTAVFAWDLTFCLVCFRWGDKYHDLLKHVCFFFSPFFYALILLELLMPDLFTRW